MTASKYRLWTKIGEDGLCRWTAMLQEEDYPVGRGGTEAAATADLEAKLQEEAPV